MVPQDTLAQGRRRDVEKWTYMWATCKKIREKGDLYAYNLQTIDGQPVQEGPLTPFLAWAGDQGWEMVSVGASDIYNGPLTLFFKKRVA